MPGGKPHDRTYTRPAHLEHHHAPPAKWAAVKKVEPYSVAANTEENPLSGDINISSFEEGLRFAITVMPPPAFQDEVGEHYKQNQRRMLAAQARVNVLNGGSLKDLLGIAMKTLEQHKEWITQIADPDMEVTAAAEGERVMLRLIMDAAMSRGERDFMDGMSAILSAMRVFFNPTHPSAIPAVRPSPSVPFGTGS
jgi:hypothetical protein